MEELGHIEMPASHSESLPDWIAWMKLEGVQDMIEDGCSVAESERHSFNPQELMSNEDDALVRSESLFARLQEAQDSAFEELEDRITVSSVVGEAILKGIITALCEESSESLEEKDTEIAYLKDCLEERDAKIIQLEIALQLKEDEWTKSVEESLLQRYKLISDFMQAIDKTEQVSVSREVYVVKKERELSEIAEHLVTAASSLEVETQRAAMLEQRLKEMRELDAIKTRQLAALTEEIDRLTLLQKSSFDMLLKRTELGYMNQVDFLVTENHRLLDVLDAKNLGQEKEKSRRLLESSDGAWHRDELLVDRSWTQEDWPSHKQRHEHRWNKRLQDLQMETAESSGVQRRDLVQRAKPLSDAFTKHIMEEERAFNAESHNDPITAQEWASSMEIDIVTTTRDSYCDEFASKHNGGLRDLLEKKNARISSLESELEEVKWMQTLESSVILAFMEISRGPYNQGNNVLCLSLGGMGERIISLKEDLQQKELTIEQLQRMLREVNFRFEMETEICLSFLDGHAKEMLQNISKYKEDLDLKDADLRDCLANPNSQRDMIATESSALSTATCTHRQLELDLDDTNKALKQGKLEVQQLQHNLRLLETLKKEAEDEVSKKFASLYSSRQEHAEQQWQQHLETEIMVEMLEGMYIDCIRTIFPPHVSSMDKAGFGSENFQDGCTLEKAVNSKTFNQWRPLLSDHIGVEIAIQGVLDSDKQVAKGIFYVENEMKNVINQLKKSAYGENKTLILIPGNQLSFSEALKQKENELSRTLMEKEKEKVKLKSQLQKVETELKSTLSSVHRQVILEFHRQVKCLLENSQKSTQYLASRIHEQISRLEEAQVKVEHVHQYRKLLLLQESTYKCKLGKYINNLQKAEEEVDLLGDEVDALLNVLEKVLILLEHYGPVFQHYPGMTELTKLVRQEVFSTD